MMGVRFELKLSEVSNPGSPLVSYKATFPDGFNLLYEFCLRVFEMLNNWWTTTVCRALVNGLRSLPTWASEMQTKVQAPGKSKKSKQNWEHESLN